MDLREVMHEDSIGLRRLYALIFNLSPSSALAYRVAELRDKDFSPQEGERPKKATVQEVREFFNRYVDSPEAH